MIINAYKRHRSHNIDGAIADYQLLTNMEPTSYIVNRIKRKLGVKKWTNKTWKLYFLVV